jgi:hypothetical protein
MVLVTFENNNKMPRKFAEQIVIAQKPSLIPNKPNRHAPQGMQTMVAAPMVEDAVTTILFDE